MVGRGSKPRSASPIGFEIGGVENAIRCSQVVEELSAGHIGKSKNRIFEACNVGRLK
jgi:hypothetical protein